MYSQTVHLFSGCPRLVRADRGPENAKVAFLQPFLRQREQDGLAGEKSFQFGKSVSNQVGNFILGVGVFNYILLSITQNYHNIARE